MWSIPMTSKFRCSYRGGPMGAKLPSAGLETGNKERPCIVWIEQKRKNNGGAKEQLISDSPLFFFNYIITATARNIMNRKNQSISFFCHFYLLFFLFFFHFLIAWEPPARKGAGPKKGASLLGRANGAEPGLSQKSVSYSFSHVSWSSF